MDLFVAGFPLDLDEEKLKKLFGIYGLAVKSAKIIKDRSTGFSRGFGFVTIEDVEEAQRAISKINGQFFDGSRITVKEAKSKSRQTDTYVTPMRWKEKVDCEGDL
jgi:cold-inducible RNA-binding protein